MVQVVQRVQVRQMVRVLQIAQVMMSGRDPRRHGHRLDHQDQQAVPARRAVHPSLARSGLVILTGSTTEDTARDARRGWRVSSWRVSSWR